MAAGHNGMRGAHVTATMIPRHVLETVLTLDPNTVVITVTTMDQQTPNPRNVITFHVQVCFDCSIRPKYEQLV